MKQIFLTSALAITLWGLASAPASAQVAGPTPTTPAPDPTAVPLDGGASLLLASGVAYGLKRLRARRRA